jgi:glutathione S-transferase
MTVIVYEHPLSPYAQKVKIALDEKGVAYETKMPSAIGSGQPDREFLQANPRGEVPALIDGETMIFDSTIILEYIEDKWPIPALLPKSPAERANARTIEDVMDTLFEPINWGMGEIRWFKRAEGERARTLEARAMSQARGIYEWLTRHLGSAQWFNGAIFPSCLILTVRAATASGRMRNRRSANGSPAPMRGRRCARPQPRRPTRSKA